MKEIMMSPMAWVNVVFMVLALAVPSIKDLLTPEFEIAIIGSINGFVAIFERLKSSGKL